LKFTTGICILCLRKVIPWGPKEPCWSWILLPGDKRDNGNGRYRESYTG